jgi:hypothetical protein
MARLLGDETAALAELAHGMLPLYPEAEFMSAEFNRREVEPRDTERIGTAQMEVPPPPGPGVVPAHVPAAPAAYSGKAGGDHGVFANSIRQASDYVRHRSPGEMRGDLENVIGRYPGVSLLVGASLGYLLGRKLRS